MDDSTSLYEDTLPQYTLLEYLAKYGYDNYFQSLRQKYNKKVNKMIVEDDKELQKKKYKLLLVEFMNINKKLQEIKLTEAEKKDIYQDMVRQQEHLINGSVEGDIGKTVK